MKIPVGVTLLAFFLSTTALGAQPLTLSTELSVGGSYDSNRGLWEASLVAQTNEPWLGKLKTTYAQEFYTFSYPERWGLEISPMVGSEARLFGLLVSGAVGAGLVLGLEDRGDWRGAGDAEFYPTRMVVTWNLPYEVQVLLPLGDRLGLGLRGLGSTNSLLTYGGLGAVVRWVW